MKKISFILLFAVLFASLVVVAGSITSPATASPEGITPTASPTFCEVCPGVPVITKTLQSRERSSGDPILPVTGELPPGSGGPGSWILPGLGVLLVAGLIGLAVGFSAGDKLRK